MVPLNGKSRLLKYIGPLAAEKLAKDPGDIVLGIPDFYPNAWYVNTPLRHDTIEDLEGLQRRRVEAALEQNHKLQGPRLRAAISRFFPSAFKHEMEMLLLAAKEQLRAVIGTSDRLGNWRVPVEEQDQQNPPKKVVAELFRRKSPKKREYRETLHAPEVLRNVPDIRAILFLETGAENCPVFKRALDWIGQKTGVPAYK